MYLPVTDDHIMPGFQHSLLGIGKLCDEDCTVLITNHSVQVCNPYGDTIFTRRNNPSIPRLWRLSIFPQNKDAPPSAPGTTATTAVYSAPMNYQVYNPWYASTMRQRASLSIPPGYAPSRLAIIILGLDSRLPTP